MDRGDFFESGKKRRDRRGKFCLVSGTLGRCMMRVMPGILSQSDVGSLPIVSAFTKKIGVSEEVVRLCPVESGLR